MKRTKAEKEALKQCLERGYHAWQNPKNWTTELEATIDSTEEFEGTLTCLECGATCELTGEWTDYAD